MKLDLFDVLLKISARSIIKHILLGISSWSKRHIFSNVAYDYVGVSLDFLDRDGKRVRVTRTRRYHSRWKPFDYFPEERITLGKDAALASYEVLSPKGANPDFLEGGIGKAQCVLRIKAPNMRPCYLLRKPDQKELTISYIALNAYTISTDNEPFSYTLRFPYTAHLPTIKVRLSVSPLRPMRSAPALYRIDDLIAVERASTDFGLEKSSAWERISVPSKESDVEWSDDGLLSVWHLNPRSDNTAYKIEWML